MPPGRTYEKPGKGSRVYIKSSLECLKQNANYSTYTEKTLPEEPLLLVLFQLTS